MSGGAGSGFGSSDQISRRVTDLERQLREIKTTPAPTVPGSIAAMGTFSLTASAASTTVTDASVTASSSIFCRPTDDGAVSLEGAIRCTPGSGSFSVSHANSTVTRSYAYVVINPA